MTTDELEQEVATRVENLKSKAETDDMVKEFAKEKRIPVVEIFGPTIQGEGPLAGSKTMFIRTGGCDFRCSKCDSLHAVIPAAVKKHSRRLTTQEIFDELTPIMAKTGTRWVTISGGNPAMWDFSELQQKLQDAGYYTSVETQGTLCPDWLQRTNMVVTSPKSPGMGEKFDAEVFTRFLQKLEGRALTALKIVIFSQQDIEFALQVGKLATETLQVVPRGMRFFSLGNPYPPVLNEALDLVDREDLPYHFKEELLRCYKSLIEEIVVDRRIDDWKFLPQIHVLVYGNESKR
jgi:7-carboxy-7-deazaguanine synthase